MDFSWTDEQLRHRDAAQEFARRHLQDETLRRDRSSTFSHELWRRCAEFGIQGLPLPQRYGGTDASALTTTLVMEALGKECKDAGLLFSLQAQMWSVQMPLLAFGTDEQKKRFLPRLCDGTLIGAHAMSEPDSGSDAFSLSTRAERRGERYVLNGAKAFVTNAPEADLFLVFATIDPAKKAWGVTAFLIERDTAGLTVGRNVDKMGLRTSPIGDLVLQDCAVPATNRLGSEGQGEPIFSYAMGWERSCILASTVGAMERELETCVDYARNRRQFGRPIGDFQLVASRIVDMKLRLETSRLLLYRAAWLLDRGDPIDVDAALAKLHIADAAVESALDAIHLHGGGGFLEELEIERGLRDAVGARLYSGTSEMQRMIVAHHLGLSPMK